jgi:hypothetical protein
MHHILYLSLRMAQPGSGRAWILWRCAVISYKRLIHKSQAQIAATTLAHTHTHIHTCTLFCISVCECDSATGAMGHHGTPRDTTGHCPECDRADSMGQLKLVICNHGCTHYIMQRTARSNPARNATRRVVVWNHTPVSRALFAAQYNRLYIIYTCTIFCISVCEWLHTI